METDFDARVAPANGYGLTETTSAVVINFGREYFDHPESVGRAVLGTDLRIVAEDGRDCPVGEVGELWARGPNIVKGYWNKPEATAAAFTEGWFHSGDLAHLDDEGFVYVVDRLKDVVIRGGENVYSAEVEAVLFEHPALEDVAVIGLPHPTYGEEVAAVVQREARVDGHRGRGAGVRRHAAGPLQGALDRVLPRRAAAPHREWQGAQARASRRAVRRARPLRSTFGLASAPATVRLGQPAQVGPRGAVLRSRCAPDLLVATMRPRPDDVARANFQIVRRGFDPVEVQGFARSVSAEIIRLQSQVDDLSKALRTAEGKSSERITEAMAAGYLGEETSRMLQTQPVRRPTHCASAPRSGPSG